MTLVEQIDADLKTAMKEKNEVTLLALRQLKSVLAYAVIAAKPKTLSVDDVIKVLRGEVKKRQESIEAFASGGRADLVDNEKAQLAVIVRYLPPEMPAQELATVVAEAVAAVKPTGPADFGKVMGLVMKKVGSRASGTAVSAAVKQAVGGK